MSGSELKIRQAAVAGAFYPADADGLRGMVCDFLNNAPEPPACQVFAVMAPHAGYVYSGKIAASSIKALSKVPFDTVVIIGHDFGMNAQGISAVFSDFDAFETPLGRVEVDTELQKAMKARLPNSIIHNGVHSREHTIEVQLPFLQSFGRPFKIVPILFGEVTPRHCRQIADALLASAGSRHVVVLASSDMTHYPTYENSRSIDSDTLECIRQGRLAELCRRSDGTAVPQCKVATPLCATGGVGVALLWAQAHGADLVQVQARCNSGDTSGDKTRVVGYGGVVFGRTGNGKPLSVDMGAEAEKRSADRNDAEFRVSARAQQELLALVRNRITAKASGQPWSYVPPADLPELSRPSAVFVTLTKGGRLRGCIGTTEARNPLWQVVEYFAMAAAFEDHRFQPVVLSEVPELHIEISVLSPLKASSVQEIVPFKHGVVVRSGPHSGLFLPQVWEQLPRLEDFMRYLCAEKAGLPQDAWKNDSELKVYTFTVAAFEETAATAK